MRGSVFLAPPILLTLAQPDVGSALVLCVIGALMVLLCAPRRMAFTFLLLAAVFAVFSWMFLFKDYQKQRVATLFNPPRFLSFGRILERAWRMIRPRMVSRPSSMGEARPERAAPFPVKFILISSALRRPTSSMTAPW